MALDWIGDGKGFFRDGGSCVTTVHNHQWNVVETLYKSDELLIGRYVYGKHMTQYICVLTKDKLKRFKVEKLPKKYHQLLNSTPKVLEEKV